MFDFIKLLFKKQFFFPFLEVIQGREIQGRKERDKEEEGAGGGQQGAGPEGPLPSKYVQPAQEMVRPDQEQLPGVSHWSQGWLLIEGLGARVSEFVQQQTLKTK